MNIIDLDDSDNDELTESPDAILARQLQREEHGKPQPPPLHSRASTSAEEPEVLESSDDDDEVIECSDVDDDDFANDKRAQLKPIKLPPFQTQAEDDEEGSVDEEQAPFQPEEDVRLQTLDRALAVATSSHAADGAPLLDEAEDQLLRRVRDLSTAHRLVLARLLVIKGGWHSLKVVAKYVSPKGAATVARESVRALSEAGALVEFDGETARKATLSMLGQESGCLINDELKPMARAAREALKKRRKQVKGDGTKAGMVGVLCTYAYADADELNDGAAAPPLAQLVLSNLRGGTERAPVRLAPVAEQLLLRALRLAERDTETPARQRPPPESRLMAATLRRNRQPRTSAVAPPPRAPTPLFATRAHFRLSEAAIELALAVRSAHVAGGEGKPSGESGEASAVELRKEARDRYARCGVVEALGFLRSTLLPGGGGGGGSGDGGGGEGPGAVAVQPPPTLPEDEPAAARDLALDLAIEHVAPLLEAYAATDDAAYVREEVPAWLQGNDAGALLSDALLGVAVPLLERRGEYVRACDLLRLLLRCSEVEKVEKEEAKEGGSGRARGGCSSLRGDCYYRLLVDLGKEGVVGGGDERNQVLAQAKKELPAGSAELWRVMGSMGESWRVPEARETFVQDVSGRVGKVGSRLLYKDDEAREVLVENRTIELFAYAANGGWCATHDEGGALRQLFGLLLWDEVYDASATTAPDAFYAPCQGRPADFGSSHFYEARKAAIDARLAEVAAASPSALAELVRLAAEAHHMKASSFVRWPDGVDRYKHVLHLQAVAVCFGGRAVAGILLHIARTGMCAGMPDLTCIKARPPASAGGDDTKTAGGATKTGGDDTKTAGGATETGGDDTTTVNVAHAWPWRAGGVVSVALVKSDKCDREDVQWLADGAALELRRERNMMAPNKVAVAVHLVVDERLHQEWPKVGYVANADLPRVLAQADLPGGAGGARAPPTARWDATAAGGGGGGGAWVVEGVASSYGSSIEVGDDWELDGQMVEVKSEKDQLWVEQRLWLRSLLEADFNKQQYDDEVNPYLFDERTDEQGDPYFEPSVKISTCKVNPTAKGGKKPAGDKKPAGGGKKPAGGGKKPAGGGKKKPAEKPAPRSKVVACDEDDFVDAIDLTED